ncbi:hypothetical protein pb186bvf_016412 [Paramecium bursaria]
MKLNQTIRYLKSQEFIYFNILIYVLYFQLSELIEYFPKNKKLSQKTLYRSESFIKIERRNIKSENLILFKPKLITQPQFYFLELFIQSIIELEILFIIYN